MDIEKIDVFPFVLSPSKHIKGFAGQVSPGSAPSQTIEFYDAADRYLGYGKVQGGAVEFFSADSSRAGFGKSQEVERTTVRMSRASRAMRSGGEEKFDGGVQRRLREGGGSDPKQGVYPDRAA